MRVSSIPSVHRLSLRHFFLLVRICQAGFSDPLEQALYTEGEWGPVVLSRNLLPRPVSWDFLSTLIYGGSKGSKFFLIVL